MNFIAKTAFGLIEKMAAKTGRVLSVRPWEEGDITEVDLHLPEANMARWQAVPYIKIKVADGIYRDYSPTMWDCETSTCTIMIDTAHKGAGAQWIGSLDTNETLTYMGISPTSHKPAASGNAFCIGDISAMGHFLAMEQLAKDQVGFSGLLLFKTLEQLEEFKSYYKTSLVPILLCEIDQIYRTLRDHNLHHQTIYMAGNIPLMAQIRKFIKQQKDFEGVVKLQGFWS